MSRVDTRAVQRVSRGSEKRKWCGALLEPSQEQLRAQGAVDEHRNGSSAQLKTNQKGCAPYSFCVILKSVRARKGLEQVQLGWNDAPAFRLGARMTRKFGHAGFSYVRTSTSGRILRAGVG